VESTAAAVLEQQQTTTPKSHRLTGTKSERFVTLLTRYTTVPFGKRTTKMSEPSFFFFTLFRPLSPSSPSTYYLHILCSLLEINRERQNRSAALQVASVPMYFSFLFISPSPSDGLSKKALQ
jgi:hypothetical protein